MADGRMRRHKDKVSIYLRIRLSTLENLKTTKDGVKANRHIQMVLFIQESTIMGLNKVKVSLSLQTNLNMKENS